MPEERVFNLTVEEGGKRVDTYVADALCALLEDEKADDRAGDFGFGDDDDLEDQEEFEPSGDAAAGTAYNAYAYRTFSRSSVKKLIDGGNVTVNGKSCKANLKLKTGDKVEHAYLLAGRTECTITWHDKPFILNKIKLAKRGSTGTKPRA